MLVNVNGIYYVHVCEQARWARSAGNSAIEHLCIIIIKHETHPPRVKKKKKKKKKEARLDSNDCDFICAGVSFVGGYIWHAWFYLSCL